MTINSAAIDTNVLLYLHDRSDDRKRGIAQEILAENPVISSQVLSEFLNVLRRQLPLSKSEIVDYVANLLQDCELIQVNTSTLRASSELISNHNFQIFDSIIVAAAISANCSVLYSEDMQHGLTIHGLRICNPFL